MVLGLAAAASYATVPARTEHPVVATGGTVSGRVVDARGEGIPGVTVIVEGTTLGASTDATGTFVIANVPAGPHTLVYSSVGLNSARVAVTVVESETAQVAVTGLTENATALNEAVVVGYGTARRQDVTGSMATANTKDFVKGQVTSPEQLIQGKLAGVQITAGGAPGEVGMIRIRGGSSLNANNDPLIVIDGVPVDNSGIAGAGNPLSLVNPSDIETFTVLKDASATAIYGSRASNGVIIITTKKGMDGEKTRVNITSQVSRSQNYGQVDVLDAQAYRNLYNAAKADGSIPATAPSFLGNATSNWQDAIYRTAWTNDNTVSLTGSARHVPYRVSVGYLGQQGTLRTGNLKCNSASIGLSPKLFYNHLRVDVKGTWADYRFADQGAIGAAVRFNPTQPIFNGNDRFNGYFEWLDPANGVLPYPLTDRNPLALLNDKRDRSTVKRSIGNVQLDYSLHFLPDLHANVNLGYDISRSGGTVDIPGTSSLEYVLDPALRGRMSQYRQEKNNKLIETYLNYTKQIGNHRVEALAGYSYQDFYTHNPFYFTLTAAGTRRNPTAPAGNPGKTQYTLLSYYGRVNYNFKSKYLLTGTLRADASSRFSPETRWGYFPAGSVTWRINQEAFLADSKTVSDLKLRFSYGITGQQDVAGVAGDYPYLGGYKQEGGSVRQIFGNDTIFTLRPAAYDRNLKWEETTTYDAGLDFGFLSNRLTGSMDMYLRRTNDLVAVIPVAAGSNFSNTLLTNIGNLENRGVELALNYNVLQGKRLNWSVNVNATMNRSKITKLTQVEDPAYQGTPVGNLGNFQFAQINSVGYAPNTFFLYKQKYDDNGKPMQGPTNSASPLQYEDLNGDGQINERDRVRTESPAPKAVLGLSSNLSYGKASLAFTLRSNLGNYVYNNVDGGQGNYYGLNTGLGYSANVVPNIYLSGFRAGQPYSDFYLQDASFVRLQNVTLGYDFGGLLKADSNLSVTLAGTNLLVLTKYTGLDPERAFGIDSNFYPLPRTVTLGVNFGF